MTSVGDLGLNLPELLNGAAIVFPTRAPIAVLFGLGLNSGAG
jgi:hypothetical protein